MAAWLAIAFQISGALNELSYKHRELSLVNRWAFATPSADHRTVLRLRGPASKR